MMWLLCVYVALSGSVFGAAVRERRTASEDERTPWLGIILLTVLWPVVLVVGGALDAWDRLRG